MKWFLSQQLSKHICLCKIFLSGRSTILKGTLDSSGIQRLQHRWEMRSYRVTGPYLLDSLDMLLWASPGLVSLEVMSTLDQGKDST